MRRTILGLSVFFPLMIAACDAPANQPQEQETATEEEAPHSDLPPPSREVFTDAECDFESWIGQKLDEGAVKASGRPYRILTPDSVMTMDHRPDRINVEHDGANNVTRVWCG